MTSNISKRKKKLLARIGSTGKLIFFFQPSRKRLPDILNNINRIRRLQVCLQFFTPGWEKKNLMKYSIKSLRKLEDCFDKQLKALL